MTDIEKDTSYGRVLGRDDSASMELGKNFTEKVAALDTSTVHVEVREISWAEPTAFMFRTHRPVFTLLMSSSTDAFETAYVEEGVRNLNKIGSVIFTPPDREIVGRSHSTKGKLRVVTCSYDRKYSEGVVGSFADLSRSQLFDCINLRSSLLSAILLRLRSEAMRPGFVSTALTESLGQAMLVEYSHLISSRDSKQEERGRLTPQHLRIIDQYLAGLSCEAPSVTAIATLCGLSERYLAKLFRAETNQPLGQYLRCAQIVKARAYLMETELSLKEVSYRLGFSTPANFSIAFRAATGETPGQFRAANSASRKRIGVTDFKSDRHQ